jgi:hypothetical protein
LKPRSGLVSGRRFDTCEESGGKGSFGGLGEFLEEMEGFGGVEAGVVGVARSEFELGQRQQRLR